MKLKYFMRGFGIGVVFTTLIVAISLSASSGTRYTEEELISKAKELGMDFAENITQPPTSEPTENENQTEDETEPKTKKNNKDKDQETTKDENEETTEATTVPITEATTEQATEATTEKPTERPTQPATEKPATSEGDITTFVIKSGMWSNHVAKALYDLNLVDSATDFDSYLIKNGYQSKIRTGTYKIKKGLSYFEIAEMITK